MFVRKKKNNSGSISIQIINKADGKYKVIKTVGSSSDDDELERLWIKAHEIMPELVGQLVFDFRSKKDRIVDDFVKDLNSLDIRVAGPELVFGVLFDRIGFNAIPNKLFRALVLSRLSFPSSKLKTIDYLHRCHGQSLSVYSLYRFLDKLHNKYKIDIEKISFNHTQRLLKGNISVVFYDITTLYFEAEDEDDLRKIGFSKDGKFQKPQIMIGLLVGESGYPIGYDIFEGNTFEGHTLLPILQTMQKKYHFKQPIAVADSALLSKENLKNLSKEKYKYIIGARIKNESEAMKSKIVEVTKKIENSQTVVLRRKDGTQLVVSYSSQRAKKDAYNREKGLKKLRLRIKSGKLVNNRIILCI
ncbi:IS1634 family transposase [Patescibacteria group bacterium]|nr:IS1634 family transposase [Patescibacteria group bacterium]